MAPKEKPDVLESTLDDLTKKYGARAILKWGDRTPTQVGAISTGSRRLDAAIGVGGIPRGRITELYGGQGGGKSTVCLHTVANAQKQGLLAAYIDAEHALDPEYAAALGVDLAELYISQPMCGEEGLEICRRLVESGKFGIVVVDSVAALVPKAEIDGDIGDAHMTLQARMMGQALRIINPTAGKTNTAVVFINQVRASGFSGFGAATTTTGGKSLPFFASLRLEVTRLGSDKHGEETVSNKTRVKVVKNKVSVPYRQAEFDIVFGVGINRAGEVIDDAVDAGLIKKSGAWYAAEEFSFRAQGRHAACEILAADSALLEAIEGKLDALSNV